MGLFGNRNEQQRALREKAVASYIREGSDGNIEFNTTLAQLTPPTRREAARQLVKGNHAKDGEFGTVLIQEANLPEEERIQALEKLRQRVAEGEIPLVPDWDIPKK